MTRLDLNVDIGEGMAWDLELLDIANRANVCCGAHAGSPELTIATIGECRKRGVLVGIHPGYPDREHFGRRSLSETLNIEEWRDSLIDQVATFPSQADYLKPHGGFYNDAAEDGNLAGSILLEILRAHPLPLLGLPKTTHESIAREAGVRFLREGFADRGYREDGRLLPRSAPGGVLTDLEAIALQVARMRDRIDSFCLHGDHEGCVERARFLRSLD